MRLDSIVCMYACNLPSANAQITLLAKNHIIIHPAIRKSLEAYPLRRRRPTATRVLRIRRTQRPLLRLRRRRHGRHAHRIRGIRRRRGRQIRKVRQRRQHGCAPQETLAVAEEVGLRPRCVRQVGAEHAPARVPHDQHEAPPPPEILLRFLVEGRERDAVLLEAVDDFPRVDELEARRHEEPDFLRESPAEHLASLPRGALVPTERQRRERRRLERARYASWRLKYAVHVRSRGVRRIARIGAVRVRIRGLGLRGLGVEATEEAAHGVGDGVGEVGGGRGVVFILGARHGRREGCRADVEGGASADGWRGRGGGLCVVRMGAGWPAWIGLAVEGVELGGAGRAVLASGDVAGGRWADGVIDETTWWKAGFGWGVICRIWRVKLQFQNGGSLT